MRAASGALLVRWRDTPTLSALQQVLARVDATAREAARPIAIIMELVPSGGAPDAEFRRRSVEAVDAVGRSIACLAVVLRASGLRASILRSVITGITMLARRQFPVRVFASLDEEARNWIAGRVFADEQGRAGLRQFLLEVEREHAQEQPDSNSAERP